MKSIVKQNLKRITSELLERFDYSEVDDLLLDIEEIEQALTPPSADEIVKELNKLYANNNWVFSTNEFGNGEDMIYCDYEDFYDNKFKSITYELAIPIPLKLAHKITSFFMSKQND